MQKKLSIMIPVFNKENYLDECFQSLVKQDWENEIEIIIVDDGSTDDSRKICENYASIYPYIKFYHKENGGVSSARNMLLKYASGEYFYWVDPDDYIAGNFWKKVKPILNMGYDFIFFDLINFSKKVTKYTYYADRTKEIKKDMLIHQFCDGVKMASHLPTKILKKSLWEGITFPENISMCEDYSVLTYIIPKVQNVLYLHENLYYYRQYEGSIVHNLSAKDIANVHDLTKLRYNHFSKCGYSVNKFGICFAEFYYLNEIILCNNLIDKIENYSAIYQEMIDELRKNYQVLLYSVLFNRKNKIKLYLLLHNMKWAIRLFCVLRKTLRQVID